MALRRRELMLAALLFGGVLERHPKLSILIAEQGHAEARLLARHARELRAQREQIDLHFGQNRLSKRAEPRGASEPDKCVELVDGPVGLDPW